MKHHVILLQESTMLKGSYLVSEYNKTEPDNEIPDIGLSSDLQKLTIKETRDHIRRLGFLEVYSTIQQPDESGNIVNVPIGQVTMIEMVLAGTGCISILFYNTAGLPVNGIIYDIRGED